MNRLLYQLITFGLLFCAIVSCKKEPVTGIKLNESSLTLAVGKTASLSATIIPYSATNQSVSWSSSDSKVVLVNYGNLTAMAVGKATITVITEDGNHKATCDVTVLQPIEPEMVIVEGGIFTMGCTDGECYDNELPHFQVTLNSFNIGKFEVTQKEWKAIMDGNPSFSQGDNLPVEQVRWNDVQVYIKKLNELTGKNYRLPTEAEWEYAARGGGKSEGYKYSGSNNIDEVAWYNCGKSQPVGKKEPNELGIYDMSGNVWEFCGDWFGSYTDSPKTNPQGPGIGVSRVVRGGSWGNNPAGCRVAKRDASPPNFSHRTSGFRLVHP